MGLTGLVQEPHLKSHLGGSYHPVLQSSMRWCHFPTAGQSASGLRSLNLICNLYTFYFQSLPASYYQWQCLPVGWKIDFPDFFFFFAWLEKSLDRLLGATDQEPPWSSQILILQLKKDEKLFCRWTSAYPDTLRTSLQAAGTATEDWKCDSEYQISFRDSPKPQEKKTISWYRQV